MHAGGSRGMGMVISCVIVCLSVCLSVRVLKREWRELSVPKLTHSRHPACIDSVVRRSKGKVMKCKLCGGLPIGSTAYTFPCDNNDHTELQHMMDWVWMSLKQLQQQDSNDNKYHHRHHQNCHHASQQRPSGRAQPLASQQRPSGRVQPLACQQRSSGRAQTLASQHSSGRAHPLASQQRSSGRVQPLHQLLVPRRRLQRIYSSIISWCFASRKISRKFSLKLSSKISWPFYKTSESQQRLSHSKLLKYTVLSNDKNLSRNGYNRTEQNRTSLFAWIVTHLAIHRKHNRRLPEKPCGSSMLVAPETTISKEQYILNIEEKKNR